MAMERKPGYILLQLTKILLCPTSKYMFLTKKYRYQYHDTCSVFPDIGLVPNFAVLPAPRLSSSPNVLHMKKIYFLVFGGRRDSVKVLQKGSMNVHRSFFSFNNSKTISAKQNRLLFFSFFYIPPTVMFFQRTSLFLLDSLHLKSIS